MKAISMNYMKLTFICLTIVFCISAKVKAQRPSDNPGYTPLEPRLLTLQHKSESNIYNPEKVSPEMVISSVKEENINIYAVYQMDNEVGKSNSFNANRKPPLKLMDFNIIYSYRYLIPYTSLDQVNKLLPNIKINTGDALTKMKMINYYVENGKIKNNKISTKQILSEITSNELHIKIQDWEFASNSLIEVIVEITSNNFNSIRPSFNTNDNFKRNLILSMPSIFQYELPDSTMRFELLSEKNNPFKLLQFNRESKDWDKVIDIFEINCTSYSWKLPSDASALSNFSFTLTGFKLQIEGDIGVPLTDLIKLDK